MPWDVSNAIQHLQLHSQRASVGRCAQYTREAIEAGGVVLARHESAKDYGPSLVQVGFQAVTTSIYLSGDVVVIQGFEGHPHGHMAMYDGTNWISDFRQASLYPGSAYRDHKPSYTIYRYPGAGSLSVGNSLKRVLQLDTPLMKGEDVGQVQTALVALGYKLTVDDLFGPETDRAIRDFQSKSGLKPDGAVGSRVRKALGID